MLETLRKWFNGDKEYFTGVALYSQLKDHERDLLEIFKKGPTHFTRQKLAQELKAHFIKLQAGKSLSDQTAVIGVKSVRLKSSSPEETKIVQDSAVPQSDLYKIYKEKADLLYKEIMNMRAELFALAREDDFSDPNSPDKIERRSKLCIDVVTKYQTVSKMYEDLDYIKLYGKLPYELPTDGTPDEYDALPDHLVKQTLDNLRKNFNKMKKREATPERLALLSKHESNIKKLAARWLLLKPEK